MSVLLGVDIGTTATKAILLHPERGVIAESERPVELRSPQPGWAEENPKEWWANLCQLSQELSVGMEVAGIGVSGMVPCAIILDERGKNIRPSIQQNDARAVEQIAYLNQALADEPILERTGSPITQQSIAPKLMWLAQHEPANFRRTSSVLGSYDLMNFWLTGNKSIELNWAVESGLFDLENNEWAEIVFQAASLWGGSLLKRQFRPGSGKESPSWRVQRTTLPQPSHRGL
jgi:xylulokinase